MYVKEVIKKMCQSVVGGYATIVGRFGLIKVMLENRICEIKGQSAGSEGVMMQYLTENTVFTDESDDVFATLFETFETEFVEEDIQAAFMSLIEVVGQFVTEWRDAVDSGELIPSKVKRLESIERRIYGSTTTIIMLTKKYYTKGDGNTNK
ncbi:MULTISPECIES: hypothetical protein [unclassified Neisseria]|uniref:hypothetical protein n=1 Tax=unclassified Neisseria TaxID=2623750 RepID=UPI002665CFD6|nr:MULTISPECIES: hypothetical protein [unclassified Neisseria]MDO1510905.1 hypothetical protein [Neisseria sp. MVDL19-042950]MDO1517195.1 hypothetical protein [Neisseria sp. MVDL18-041461]MDO1564536.1 hypothetical protein [Neisseria sp. MVDL20-010259]